VYVFDIHGVKHLGWFLESKIDALELGIDQISELVDSFEISNSRVSIVGLDLS